MLAVTPYPTWLFWLKTWSLYCLRSQYTEGDILDEVGNDITSKREYWSDAHESPAFYPLELEHRIVKRNANKREGSMCCDIKQVDLPFESSASTNRIRCL